MKKVEFVYLAYVPTTPEKLWRALTTRLCTVAIGCLIAVQARPVGPAGKLAPRAEADGLSAAEVTVSVK